MKKFILASMVMLLLIPNASAQTHNLGIEVGETYDFELRRWQFSEDGTAETVVTIEDEGKGNGTLTMKEGDTFSIKIMDIIYDNEDKEWRVRTEYTANGVTIEYFEWVDFGGFVTERNWDEYKSEYLTEETDTEFGTDTYELIDTADEFGFINDFSYSYSYENDEYSSKGTTELRYEKSTGVINYYKISGSYHETSSGVTEDGTTSFEMVRVGYSIPNSDGGPALPGFEFIWVSTLLVVPILRRKLN